MRATKQHFHVVLLIILFKMSLTFKSVNEFEATRVTIQIKAIEQYFHE